MWTPAWNGSRPWRYWDFGTLEIYLWQTTYGYTQSRGRQFFFSNFSNFLVIGFTNSLFVLNTFCSAWDKVQCLSTSDNWAGGQLAGQMYTILRSWTMYLSYNIICPWAWILSLSYSLHPVFLQFKIPASIWLVLCIAWEMNMPFLHVYFGHDLRLHWLWSWQQLEVWFV